MTQTFKEIRGQIDELDRNWDENPCPKSVLAYDQRREAIERSIPVLVYGREDLLDAAQEMLEALEAVMSYVHNVRKHIDDGFALGLVFEFEKIVTAAIAKAKGETA